MFSDLNSLAPICLTIISSTLIAKSYFGLKIENITKPSDSVLMTIENLANQKADSIIGAVVLFVSFLWQMINLTLPVTWEFGRVSLQSVGISLLLTIFVFGVLYAGSKKLAKIFFTNAVSRLVNRGCIE
jgi:hypothetical protein